MNQSIINLDNFCSIDVLGETISIELSNGKSHSIFCNSSDEVVEFFGAIKWAMETHTSPMLLITYDNEWQIYSDREFESIE